MKRFDTQKTPVPENAQDILDILRTESTADVVNYSNDNTISGLVFLVPYSRQTGKGFGHVALSKKDFEWLKQAVETTISRPIVFHCLTPASS